MSRNSQRTGNGQMIRSLLMAATMLAVPHLAYAQDGTSGYPTVSDQSMVPMPSPIVSQSEESQTKKSDTQSVALEVSEINQRMALMTAQLAEMELKLKIAKLREEIETVGKDKSEKTNLNNDLQNLDQMSFNNNFNSFPMPQKSVGMPRISKSDILDVPTLVAVEGIDSDIRALISETGRSVRKVRVGSKIGDWTVSAITMDSVTITNGKKEENLFIEYLDSQKSEKSDDQGTNSFLNSNQQMNPIGFGQ